MYTPDTNVQEKCMNFALSLADIRARHGAQVADADAVVEMAKKFQNYVEGK